MKISYLSSSIIPSRAANSVHVMRMCQAFAKNGHDITLVASKGKKNVNPYNFYNIDESFNINYSLKISYLSFLPRLLDSILEAKKADLVYTRWPLAALVIDKLLNKKMILELHHPPTSFFKNIIEKLIINSSKISCYVFITEKLRKYYFNEYSILHKKNTIVLPDGAAPVKDNHKRKKNTLSKLKCGYIGSFYHGKGIDVVLEIANRMPKVEFHVVGGTKEKINKKKKKIENNNVKWYGFLPNNKAMDILGKIDIALLPNQPKVLIGDGQTDIGRFTSPLKMFEYMAYGKAIISSDLPVLKEILKHKKNSVLVNPKNVDEWVNAIRELQQNKELFNKISTQAKKDLETKYSWVIRAKKVLKGLQ